MAQTRTERALVLVKAFPQPSQKYEETVCCAGINPLGEFVRLYPVRYRHLRADQQFVRWDVIEYEQERPSNDPRPESRHISEDSIRVVQRASQLSDDARVASWAPHVSESLVALRAANVESGKSLGIVKPDQGSVRFRPRKLQAGSPEARQLSSDFKQVSLIDANPLPDLVVEYEFSYRFTSAGNKHDMKTHDWEVQAAYFAYKRRYGESALDKLREEYEVSIPSRHLHLVMGTMLAHPRQFIAIGLLRTGIDPEDATRQGSLI
jgi:hypothetical protein